MRRPRLIQQKSAQRINIAPKESSTTAANCGSRRYRQKWITLQRRNCFKTADMRRPARATTCWLLRLAFPRVKDIVTVERYNTRPWTEWKRTHARHSFEGCEATAKTGDGPDGSGRKRDERSYIQKEIIIHWYFSKKQDRRLKTHLFQMNAKVSLMILHLEN